MYFIYIIYCNNLVFYSEIEVRRRVRNILTEQSDYENENRQPANAIFHRRCIDGKHIRHNRNGYFICFNSYYSKAVEEYSSKITSISLIYGNTCIVRSHVRDVILSDDMALKKMSWNKVQEVGRSIDSIMEALRPRMQNKEELTLCEILHSV